MLQVQARAQPDQQEWGGQVWCVWNSESSSSGPWQWDTAHSPSADTGEQK